MYAMSDFEISAHANWRPVLHPSPVRRTDPPGSVVREEPCWHILPGRKTRKRKSENTTQRFLICLVVFHTFLFYLDVSFAVFEPQ